MQINCIIYFANRKTSTIFAPAIKEIIKFKILRGGAVAARWAHNPKVTGSSPVPATKEDSSSDLVGSPSFLFCFSFVNECFTVTRVVAFEVR